MHLAANAAMNLGKWDKLEKYVSKLDTDKDRILDKSQDLNQDLNQDKKFWQAAININNGKFDEARI